VISWRSRSTSLHPEGERLEQPEAAAIEERRHQSRDALKLTEHLPDLVACEDDGQSRGHVDADDDGEGAERLADDMRVEKEQRGEGLILGGGADPVAGGERGEKVGGFIGAEGGGVWHAMVGDEAAMSRGGAILPEERNRAGRQPFESSPASEMA